MVEDNKSKLWPEWQGDMSKRAIVWWYSGNVSSFREVLDSLAFVQNWWWEVFMHGSELKRHKSKGLGEPWVFWFSLCEEACEVL